MFFKKRPEKLRLIDRDDVFFHQSRGDIAVRKIIDSKLWRSLYVDDWFHSLAHAPTVRLIAYIVGGYLLLIPMFAVPFFIISHTAGCNLHINTFGDAFAYSLMTTSTIGYG